MDIETLLESGRGALDATVEAVRAGRFKTKQGTPIHRLGYEDMWNTARAAVKSELKFDPLRMPEYIAQFPAVLDNHVGGGKLADVMENAVVDQTTRMVFGDVIDAVLSQYPSDYAREINIWVPAGAEWLSSRGAPISASFKRGLREMEDIDLTRDPEADIPFVVEDMLPFMIDEIAKNIRGPYVPRAIDDEYPAEHELSQRLREISEYLAARRSVGGESYASSRKAEAERTQATLSLG